MEPVMISIPHIKNFKEELNSGVISVRMIYDEITLDESGNLDLQRKALTGKTHVVLAFDNFSFFP